MADQPNFDFNELMEKAKEMQTKMQDVQGQIAEMVIVGVSGGGMVKVHKRGNQYAVKTEIDTSLVPGLSLQDREMLEDLVTAAINDAVDKIEANTKDKITQLAGIDLPEGFGPGGALPGGDETK
jgi:DNA-binding YbaB/EbfC family protein